MSYPVDIHKKKRKQNNPNKEMSPINIDILTYIQKVQNDNNKAKMLNQSKNQMPIQVERILTNKLIGGNDSTGLNEDMTYEKDKRFTAKKGLLYLLNNLSNGTFCPDIEEYFAKMKEAKIEELKHKKNALENNKIVNDDNLENNSIKKYNLIKKTTKEFSPSQENIFDSSKNMRVIENKNKNSAVINEKFGLKKYDKDYDADDLINLYDKNEIKDNTFQINYNKEKRYKMKLKMENKSNNS
jgi:hypothetical protein